MSSALPDATAATRPESHEAAPTPQEAPREPVSIAARLSALDALPETAAVPSAPDPQPEATPDGQGLPAVAAPDASVPEPPDAREQELAALRAEQAAFARREAALRGQVENAARQAEAKVRADMQAQERQRITAELDAAERSGEYDPDAVKGRRAEYQAQWDRQDLAAQQREVASQREALQQGVTALQAQALLNEARGVAANIPAQAATVFAQQYGLPVDVVRQYLSDPTIRETATKAYFQSSLYGIDTFEMYMDSLGDRLAVVRQLHDGEERRRQAEAARQLTDNRNAAATSGAYRAQPALVGGRSGPDTSAYRGKGDGAIASVLNLRDGLTD